MTRRPSVPLLGAAGALAASVALGLAAGPAGWRSPFALDGFTFELRAPRVLLAGLVGASLAVAGVAMQALLQIDLADPYILGVSGGASAGAVASLALGLPPGPAAALGAAGAVGLVRGLARGPFDPARLVLAGVAVGSVLAALTGLVLVLAPADHLLRSATFWLFGGVGTPRWSTLVWPLVTFAAATGWMRLRAERLDRLTLGPDVATSLGVDVDALGRGVLVSAVALTAVAVAAAGLVGFVGLLAPHAARRWVGAGHRRLLPAAAVGGALLLVVADTGARTLFAPREVPVGLVTAVLGGPFFLWQLQRGSP